MWNTKDIHKVRVCGSLKMKWEIVTTQTVGQFWSFHSNRIQWNFLGLSTLENSIVGHLFSWPIIIFQHHFQSTLMHASHLGTSNKFHVARNWLLDLQPFMIGHCHFVIIVEPVMFQVLLISPNWSPACFVCSVRWCTNIISATTI